QACAMPHQADNRGHLKSLPITLNLVLSAQIVELPELRTGLRLFRWRWRMRAARTTIQGHPIAVSRILHGRTESRSDLSSDIHVWSLCLRLRRRKSLSGKIRPALPISVVLAR